MYLVVREGRHAFVAPLLTEDANVFVGIPDNNPANVEVKVDGQPAKRWESLFGNTQEQYIGVISGPTNRLAFCSAADCPERRIEK